MVAKKKKAVKKAAKASVKKATAKKSVKKTATAKKAAPKVVKKAVKKAAPKAKAKATAAPKPKTATSKKAATPAKSAAKKPANTVAASSKKSSTSKPSSKETSRPTQNQKKVTRKVTTASDDLSFGNYTPYEFKKGEDYMNAEQIEHFRKILQGWKRELMDKVDETMHHLQDEAANFPDPNDRASQESEFTLELRTRDRERKLIKKIDESLKALDDDEYGYCTSCGIDIGIRRLEARPTATQCIDCKTLNEIREKQYGK